MLRLITPATAVAQARRVVGAPEPGDDAQLRILAWSVLKAERGQTVRQSVLRPKRAPAPFCANVLHLGDIA